MINLFIPFATTNKASLNPESFCPLLQTTSMSIYDKKPLALLDVNLNMIRRYNIITNNQDVNSYNQSL